LLRGALLQIGNPPALPGDFQSLIVPGVSECLPSVNRSKFLVKEAFDEQQTEFMPYKLGLQVSHCLNSRAPTEGVVRKDQDATWRSFSGIGSAA